MESYTQMELEPPAPIIDIKVSHPTNRDRFKIIKGLIDSGACMSVIPKKLISQLGLKPRGEIKVRSFKEKKPQTHYTSSVNVSFNDYSNLIEVIPIERENMLIGRDILNDTKLLLDGKNLQFEITDP